MSEQIQIQDPKIREVGDKISAGIRDTISKYKPESNRFELWKVCADLYSRVCGEMAKYIISKDILAITGVKIAPEPTVAGKINISVSCFLNTSDGKISDLNINSAVQFQLTRRPPEGQAPQAPQAPQS